LKVKQTRDRLSVLGGITPEVRLFTRVQRRAIRGPDCVTFLKRIREHLRPKLLVTWDGTPIPRCDEVAWYLADTAPGMVPVERLPGYAPELNPEEGVWEHAKNVELRNCCFADLDHLSCGLTHAIARMPHDVSLIQSFFQGAGLDL
jgi:transposase